MKSHIKKLIVLACFGGFIFPSVGSAIDLKQAKFTQIVNDVKIISAEDKSFEPAVVNGLFKMPDLIRTGSASRAELVADDDTVTRVGGNTIFSFDKANRTIDLQQGSLLFHSPHGKGGGTIHTASATASVLGTTLIVSVSPNGAVKVLDLEGKVEVRLKNGHRQILKSGQMILVLPDGQQSSTMAFNLEDESKGSLLVSGFNQPLPSLPLINNQIANQLASIQNLPAVGGALSTVNGALSTGTTAIVGGGNVTLPSATLPVLVNPIPTLPQNILPTDVLPTIGH
ncbi:MAG TPA: FecR family protein [Methylomirabilota bacterium]|nr:FecR family protein [Methylomirabilota bacterium]